MVRLTVIGAVAKDDDRIRVVQGPRIVRPTVEVDLGAISLQVRGGLQAARQQPAPLLVLVLSRPVALVPGEEDDLLAAIGLGTLRGRPAPGRDSGSAERKQAAERNPEQRR